MSKNYKKNKIKFLILVFVICSVFSFSSAQESVLVGPSASANVAKEQPGFWQRTSNYFKGIVNGLTQGAQTGIEKFNTNDGPGAGLPNRAIGETEANFRPPVGGYSSGNSSAGVPSGTSYQSGIICKSSDLKSFKDVVFNLIIGCILNPAVLIFMGLSVVVFLWGVFKFVFAEADGDKQKAKDFILWGIIGLFVMISVWGLENILENTFKLNNTDIQVRPVNINL